MEGRGGSNGEDDGVTPRSVRALFDLAAERGGAAAAAAEEEGEEGRGGGKGEEGAHYSFSVRCLEIYNETVRDLLTGVAADDVRSGGGDSNNDDSSSNSSSSSSSNSNSSSSNNNSSSKANNYKLNELEIGADDSGLGLGTVARGARLVEVKSPEEFTRVLRLARGRR